MPVGTKIVPDGYTISDTKMLDKEAFSKQFLMLSTNNLSQVNFCSKYILKAGVNPITAERVKDGATIR